MTGRASAGILCLVSQEIVHGICIFQYGIEEFLWEMNQAFPLNEWNALVHVVQHIDHVNEILMPWYERYSIESVAIVLGHRPNLNVLFTTHALIFGRLKMIDFLDNLGVIDRKDPYHILLAACYGQLEIVCALNDRQYAANVDAMDTAAMNGHLKVVKFLDSFRNEGCSTQAMDLAASNGYIDVVRYLHENREEGCTSYAMDCSARNGHLDVVQFLHYHRDEGCNTWAMNFAAANGHLSIVEFLHNNRSEGCTTSAMDEASKGGHLSVVQFLHINRNEGCTTDAMDYAAENKHFDVLEYLRKHRTEGCTRKARELALARGETLIFSLLDLFNQRQKAEQYSDWRWKDYFGGRP